MRTAAVKFDVKLFDSLLARGLCNGPGSGDLNSGQVCVEQALALACGEVPAPGSEVTDQPSCALVAARRFAIKLNDAIWPSSEARSKGMRALAIAQVGTSHLDGREFARRLAEATIREIVPVALRAAAKRVPAHADALEAAAKRCEAEGTEKSARDARKIAAAAAAADAADAADAAAYAAYAAAYAADAYAAAAAARSQVLTLSADIGARILNEMREEYAKAHPETKRTRKAVRK